MCTPLQSPTQLLALSSAICGFATKIPKFLAAAVERFKHLCIFEWFEWFLPQDLRVNSANLDDTRLQVVSRRTSWDGRSIRSCLASLESLPDHLGYHLRAEWLLPGTRPVPRCSQCFLQKLLESHGRHWTFQGRLYDPFCHQAEATVAVGKVSENRSFILFYMAPRVNTSMLLMSPCMSWFPFRHLPIPIHAGHQSWHSKRNCGILDHFGSFFSILCQPQVQARLINVWTEECQTAVGIVVQPVPPPSMAFSSHSCIPWQI